MSMLKHDREIIHSSEDPNWRTPPACFTALNREFDFAFDLAANVESTCCLAWLGPGSPHGEDALRVSWADLTDFTQRTAPGNNFLNPPFSKTLASAYRTGRIKRGGVWVDHPVDRELARVYQIESWAEKCWRESEAGATVVGIFPFAPQTDWYRRYVYGFGTEAGEPEWLGHAAREERRLPHRISFLRPDGSPAGNAGVNSVIVVWKPSYGIVGPWTPHTIYWSYR